jgi:type I restriction-modification system DNA methylase subunit
MPIYTCELCGKQFSQKNGLRRHMKRKNKCVPTGSIDNKLHESYLEAFFRFFCNKLRDREGIITLKALNIITDILFLRLINKDVESGNIDLMNEEYYNDVDDELLQYCLWDNIKNIDNDRSVEIFCELWEKILSVHPKTKNIFKDKFVIKDNQTLNDIINEINYIDKKLDAVDKNGLDIVDENIKSGTYQNFLNEELKGKLSIYNTPINITKIIINDIKPQVHKTGKTDTVLDLCSGTNNILVETYKYLKVAAIKNKIKLDKKYVINNALNSIEPNHQIYKLGLLNMMLVTGEVCSNVINGNSIENNLSQLYFNSNKFDIIISNPMFGKTNYSDIVGTKQKGFNETMKEYLPFRSNSSIMLYIQVAIYCLKKNGKCAIWAPNGQDMFSKTKNNIDVRKYLMETCNLWEVMLLPQNSSNVSTQILYFQKGPKTKKVLFTQHNGDDKGILCEVDVTDIKNNDWSLNYKEYTKTKKKQLKKSDIKKHTLSSLCDIKDICVDKSSEEHIIIDEDNTNIYMPHHGLHISNISDNINGKYLYYYLKITLYDKICNTQTTLNINDLKNIKFSVPQNTITAKLNSTYKDIELSEQKIKTLEQKKKTMMQTVHGEYGCKDKKMESIDNLTKLLQQDIEDSKQFTKTILETSLNPISFKNEVVTETTAPTTPDDEINDELLKDMEKEAEEMRNKLYDMEDELFELRNQRTKITRQVTNSKKPDEIRKLKKTKNTIQGEINKMKISIEKLKDEIDTMEDAIDMQELCSEE